MATGLCRLWAERNVLLCHALTSDQFEPLSADQGWRWEAVVINFGWFDAWMSGEKGAHQRAGT